MSDIDYEALLALHNVLEAIPKTFLQRDTLHNVLTYMDDLHLCAP